MTLNKLVKAIVKASREAERAEKKRQSEAARSAKIQAALAKKVAQRNARIEQLNQKQTSQRIEAYKDSFRITIQVSPDQSSDWLDTHFA